MTFCKKGFIMDKKRNVRQICYKHLFNTLNYQKSHFPPPEPPNEKKDFEYFINLFESLLNVKHADLLFQEAFPQDVYEKFQSIMKRKPHPGDDILIMVLSSITPRQRKKISFQDDFDRNYAKETMNNSWELFQTRYTPGDYGDLTRSEYKFLIKDILSNSLHLVSILQDDIGADPNAVCICNPLLFGMGDTEWEKFIIKILSLLMSDENDPQYTAKINYACKAFNLAEQYQFVANSAMLYKAWQPPLYRVIPAQLDSAPDYSLHNGMVENVPKDPEGNILWVKGFAEGITPILWEWDKLNNVLHDSGITSFRCEKCGCMGEQAIIDNGAYKKRAAMFMELYDPALQPNNTGQLFSFCASLRQEEQEGDSNLDWQPSMGKDKNELSPLLKTKLQTAEDFSLLHTVSNFKKMNPDYPEDYQTFLCNCHKNWCLQLRPQNENRDKRIDGKKIRINGIQKAHYYVRLTGNCGDCDDCFKEHNPNNNSVEFVCPVNAFSGRSRCIGCLTCVRHCFRKHGKLTDVKIKGNMIEINTRGLIVTRLLHEEDLPVKVPETKWDCDKERLEAAFKDDLSGLNWQQFQYKIT